MEKSKIIFGHDFLKMLGRTRLRPGGLMTDWLLDVESEGKHEELLQKSKVFKNLIEKTKMAEEFIY